MKHILGLELEDSEYTLFWSRFDTSGDGCIDYAEFNNRLGGLIHPPAGQLLMNRPETPRIKDWQRKRMAAAVKTKMKNLKESFNAMDTDGSGSISHPEFIQALRKLGLTKIGNEESFQMMRKHKARDDPSEDLSYDEFVKTMTEYMNLPDLPDTGETVDARTGLPVIKLTDAEKMLGDKLYGKFAHVQKAFRMFDEDKSGALDHSEFKLALRSLGINMSERDFTTLCMQYDSSGDGSISYDEFNSRVGPLIHPEAADRSKAFTDMEARAGAQSGLVYKPGARLGLNATDKLGNILSQSARARLIAPRLGLTEGEAIIARTLYGRYSDVQKAFREMDLDGSGALNPKEFNRSLEAMGVRMSKRAFDELLAKYDSSGDGEISYDEFNAIIGPLLAKSAVNDDILGFAEERGTPHPTSRSSARGSAAPGMSVAGTPPPPAHAAPGDLVLPSARGSRSARGTPRSARGTPRAAPKISTPRSSRGVPDAGLYAEAKASVPHLTLPKGGPSAALAASPMAASVRSKGSHRSRPMSAISTTRSERSRRGSGHAGLPYDRKTGFVGSVRRPSGGTRRMSARGSVGMPDDLTSIGSVDLHETEVKMRKILGKSWTHVYKDIRKKQERDAGSVISTHRFRDLMAERGVPLTSKEVRALARRYSAATPDPDSVGRDLDYGRLLRSTFDEEPMSRPLSALTSLPSGRRMPARPSA